MQARLTLASLALLLLASSGCVAVKPWERGRLAHPAMASASRMGDTYRPHVLSIREGAVGGEGDVGGGCGCN